MFVHKIIKRLYTDCDYVINKINQSASDNFLLFKNNESIDLRPFFRYGNARIVIHWIKFARNKFEKPNAIQ